VFSIQAASLGIDPSAESAPTYPTYPYRGRGRGRGRGFYRGAARGGSVRASMKLDNRPKRLLVQDIGSDSIQAVRDWYEAGGQVDAFETLENGDVVVTFRTRAAAEQVSLLNVVPVRSIDLRIFVGSRQRTQYPISWPKTNKLVQCFTDRRGSDD
jgi:hypothetical protein